MNRVVTGLLLLIALEGCMVGPDYERPVIPVPDNWHVDLDYKTTGQSSDDSSLTDLAWTEIFADVELQRAIEKALTHNKDLLVAIERISQARAANTVSRSRLYPSVDLELHGEREDESKLTNTNPELVDEFTLAPALSWEIDIWGANRRSSNAALAEYLAAAYGAQAVRLSLIADVALAYFELQGTISRLGINHQTLDARERALEIAQKRHKGGLTSKLEVIQSEVEVASTRSNIPGIEQQQLTIENQLSVLMGQPPAHFNIASNLEDHIVPAKVTAGLSTDLLHRRPDIMQAEQNLVSASERVGVAKSRLLPNIRLTGARGYETAEFDDLLDSDGKAWIVELDVLMPIFNAGARRAELSAAESRYNEARFLFENTVLESLREVSDSLNRFYKTTEKLDALLDLESLSNEYLTLADKRYRNGVLAYIDVLDARRQLFDAQLSVSLARQEQLFSLVNLYKALGGGWDASEIQALAEDSHF